MMQYTVRLVNIPETDQLVFKLIFSLSEKVKGRTCSYKVNDDKAINADDIMISGYPGDQLLNGRALGHGAIIYNHDNAVQHTERFMISKPLIATRVLSVLDNYVSELSNTKKSTNDDTETTETDKISAFDDQAESEVDFFITEEEASELAIVDDESLSNPSNETVARIKSLAIHTDLSLLGYQREQTASLLTLHPNKDHGADKADSESTGNDVITNRPRALVVDDSPSVRKQIELELDLYNVDVDYAQNMAEAIDLSKNNQYGIAFLDVVLPDGDGFQICKTIKYDCKDTTVIMLTGKASPADKIKGKMAGCDAYLVKPVGRMTFQNTVCKYLKLREQFEAVHG